MKWTTEVRATRIRAVGVPSCRACLRGGGHVEFSTLRIIRVRWRIVSIRVSLTMLLALHLAEAEITAWILAGSVAYAGASGNRFPINEGR